MAEEKSNEYTPPAFSFTDEASPSTSRDNTQGASPALGAYPTIFDDAWPYQWNMQPRPVTDGTYNLDGVTENASTSFLLLGSSNSIDHERPSTSCPGMEQATAILEDGARRWCSGGAETAMVERSKSGHTPPAFTFADEATPSTSQEFFEDASWTSDCHTTICDDSFEELWNALNSNNDAMDVTGHTHVTESGSTSSPSIVSSSSIHYAQPSTSHAGMDEASAIPENIARIPETTGVDQWNTQYHLADTTSTDFGRCGKVFGHWYTMPRHQGD
ncbi:uncharacterized protein [Dermacentor andersoni]|uniref:uncharacterized protein n=1 Tax=Dermacentor andersoni TaxID=34620 RepID=UPI003B3B4F76